MSCGRKDKRHTLPRPIDVFDTFNSACLGTLVNISSNGILIAGEDGLDIDSIYQLELRFPEPFAGCLKLSVGVDCLWVDKAGVIGQLYWSGCQIIDISDEDKKALENVLSLLENNEDAA